MLRDAVADRRRRRRASAPVATAAVERIAEALRARGQARRRKRTITTLAARGRRRARRRWRSLRRHRAHREAGPSTAAHDAQDPRNLGRLVDPTGGVTAVREGHAEAVGSRRSPRRGAPSCARPPRRRGLDFDSGTHVTIGGVVAGAPRRAEPAQALLARVGLASSRRSRSSRPTSASSSRRPTPRSRCAAPRSA